MLSQYVSVSWHFEGSMFLSNIINCPPSDHCHILEHLNPEQLRCENVVSGSLCCVWTVCAVQLTCTCKCMLTCEYLSCRRCMCPYHNRLCLWVGWIQIQRMFQLRCWTVTPSLKWKKRHLTRYTVPHLTASGHGRMTWTLVSSDVVMFSGYCVILVTTTDLPNCSLIFSFVLCLYVMVSNMIYCRSVHPIYNS